MPLTPRRICALCETKIKYNQRLCPKHLQDYGDQLTEPWLSGIIAYAEYQYNVERRDVDGEIRRVVSLERFQGRI